MASSRGFFTAVLLRFFVVLAAGLCFFSCKETPAVQSRPALPLVREPVFSVSSIKILQAELVNTRLKVKLRIENPNPFPVTLSSFEYELYGEGLFWADGTEKNVFTVPASGFAEKDLFLVMNFIDMKRDLLDKVIAMEMVAYRFAGTVKINAGDLPIAANTFSLEGESEVTR